MKYRNITLIKLAAMAFAAGMIASCSEDIEVNSVDDSRFDVSENPIAFISDQFGKTETDDFTFSGTGTTDFYVNSTKAADSQTECTLVYDAQVLEDYNAANGTSLAALPESLVTIGTAGSIAQGENKSSAITVTFKSDDSLDSLGEYVIPLSLKSAGSLTVSEQKGSFIYKVKDITKMPNCDKGNGLQVISCMEVNDANPLHNLCYTLKDSGKPLFDQVILFSGNINYNVETGEVYNYNNENVQHLLDYREKYLVPLQQKGIKVILGILGNHDRASIMNLTEEGAKKFARELKAVMDAYDLDGVFFDDEYSNPGNYPGFEPYESTEAFSRLCYFLKEMSPDKLIEVYVYSGTSSMTSYDGHEPGEFCDYAIQDYGNYYDLSGNYEGLPKSGMIQASSEFARGRIISQSTAQQIKDDEYGGTMVFSLNPNNGYVSRLNRISIPFYGEETIQTGSYPKDW